MSGLKPGCPTGLPAAFVGPRARLVWMPIPDRPGTPSFPTEDAADRRFDRGWDRSIELSGRGLEVSRLPPCLFGVQVLGVEALLASQIPPKTAQWTKT